MVVAGAAVAQQSTAPAPAQRSSDATPSQAPASAKGTVLFERHTTGDAAGTDAPGTEAAPVPAPAANRRHHRQGLQRREASTTVTPEVTGVPPERPAAAAVSSSEDAAIEAQPAAASALSEKGAELVQDTDRRAVRIASTELDVHLNRHTGEITARARLLVRNAGATPISRLPLQISSALRWERARVQGVSPQPLTLEQHRLTTDADHTGAADEAVLSLPSALAAGGAVTLEVFYGGRFEANADRLLRLGAPAERAAQSDWDTVSDSFTGLRGFGNVLWFPVSAAPAFLADGASFASAVDAQRATPQTFSLRLTLEGQDAGASQAFFLGRPADLVDVSSPPGAPEQESGHTSLQTAEWPAISAGPHPVSLFLSSQTPLPAQNGVRVSSTDAAAVEAYRTSAARVHPLLESWLGGRPANDLNVLDLPVTHGQPFADGALLVLPVSSEDTKVLAPALVYPLASAWLAVGLPAWLEEGLPEFLRLLYLEQTAGHDSLLAELNAGGGVLAREEGFRTATSPALAQCADVICARTKAAYVFNMLRQIAGEQALQQAVVALLAGSSASQSQADAVPPAASVQASDSASRLLALLDRASGKDLRWFFQDWIERDAGLPDLSIVSVAPRRVERSLRTDYLPSQRRPVGGPIGAEPVAQAGDPQKTDSSSEASRDRVAPAEGSWLVAVAVRNDGDVAAEVPVTVRAAGLQNSLPLRIAAHSVATVRVPFEAAPEEVWVNDGSTPELRSVTHHRTIQIPVDAR